VNGIVGEGVGPSREETREMENVQIVFQANNEYFTTLTHTGHFSVKFFKVNTVHLFYIQPLLEMFIF
jgi:hypothetical protein